MATPGEIQNAATCHLSSTYGIKTTFPDESPQTQTVPSCHAPSLAQTLWALVKTGKQRQEGTH